MVAHKKPNLPTKVCSNCGLSFSWRKKWARTWDTVKYCSERCRRNKPSGANLTDIDPIAPPR